MELDEGTELKIYLITVKFPKDPNHDPLNKVTGECPLTSGDCTDVTGAHHTMALESDETADEVRDRLSEQFHVTRVEEVPSVNYIADVIKSKGRSQ